MTPPATKIPGLRGVRLDGLPLAPVPVEEAVRRVLPPVAAAPALGTAFASSI